MIFPTIISDATNHLENKNQPDPFSFVRLPSSLQFSSSGVLWKTTFMVASALLCVICFVCACLPVCIFRGKRRRRSGALPGNSYLLARGSLASDYLHWGKQIYSVICCTRDDNLKCDAFPLFMFHFTYIRSSRCKFKHHSSRTGCMLPHTIVELPTAYAIEFLRSPDETLFYLHFQCC